MSNTTNSMNTTDNSTTNGSTNTIFNINEADATMKQ